jgi:hypothetical protein
MLDETVEVFRDVGPLRVQHAAHLLEVVTIAPPLALVANALSGASPVVVAGDAAQVRSEQHESIDALRIGGREDRTRGRRLGEPEDRRALDAHRVHDGPDVVHP